MQNCISIIVISKRAMEIVSTNYQLYLLLLLCNIFWIDADPLVQISQGILNGTLETARNGRNYSAFMGIPYAQPPIGNLRFANPLPASNWSGIRAANIFGNMCAQINSTNQQILGSEDCLYLNVYSPFLQFNSSSTNTSLPVMVWIPGGGFLTGGGNQYGARYILDKDVILVTINYRLGIFGFFSTGDSVAPGNFGMKDQVLALKWVQQNIKSFGGDPNQVTIFGESAGGASVSLHALSNASSGLFQKYIIQSGANLSPWAYQKRANFVIFMRALSPLVVCPLITNAGIVNCMRKKSSNFLLSTSSIFSQVSRLLQLTWTPTDEPEAEDAFLTDSPINLIKDNQMKDLPFMSGVVANEGLLITNTAYTNTAIYALLKANLDPIIAYISAYYLGSSNIITFTPAVNSFYFDNFPLLLNKTVFLENLTNFLSDGFFFYPQIRMLEIVTPQINSDNFFYSFGYRGTFNSTVVGVGHGAEVVYLFNLTFGSTQISDLDLSATDISVSKIMVDFWTSFAINGTPTSSELSDPNIWSPYTTQTGAHIQVGNINNNTDPSITLSNTFYTDRIDFWREYAPISTS